MTHSTSRRALAATVLALAALPAVTACQSTNPVASQMSYEPGDGTSAHVGDVTVRNIVLVAERKNGPGVLSAAVSNSGAAETAVTLVVGTSAPIRVTVPPHGIVLVGPAQGGSGPASGQTVSGRFDALPVEPGRLAEVRVTTPSGGTTVTAPVHPATGIYASLTPGPLATSSSPAGSGTTGSPAASPAPARTTAPAGRTPSASSPASASTPGPASTPATPASPAAR